MKNGAVAQTNVFEIAEIAVLFRNPNIADSSELFELDTHGSVNI